MEVLCQIDVNQYQWGVQKVDEEFQDSNNKKCQRNCEIKTFCNNRYSSKEEEHLPRELENGHNIIYEHKHFEINKNMDRIQNEDKSKIRLLLVKNNQIENNKN